MRPVWQSATAPLFSVYPPLPRAQRVKLTLIEKQTALLKWPSDGPCTKMLQQKRN